MSGWDNLDDIPKGFDLCRLPDGGVLFSGKAFLESVFASGGNGCMFEDGRRYDAYVFADGRKIAPPDYELSQAGWDEHRMLAAERFLERLPEDAVELRRKTRDYLAAIPGRARKGA